jgi:type I restriction enzyme S subunit
MVSTPMAAATDGAWHGAVPAGWSLTQLKWAVTFQRGHDLPTEDRQEGPVPVVSGGGITGWHNVAQARGPGIVTGRYGIIGEFYLVEQDYWPLNTSLYSIDLHGNHAGFLRYMLEPLAPLFHLNAAKSAVPGIDRSDIHTIPIAVPPLATQRAIAAYLDCETARLDGLVAAKERVLELLAEKRRALITRVVTRGLNSRDPFRDSGIPWLGEIPAHWGIWKVGHFADVGNGSTPSRDNAEYWTEGLIPWLNSSVVNQEEVTEADQFITEKAFRECHLPLVKSGSVLVGITGQGKTRGQAVVLSFEATINQHLAFITPEKCVVDPWFLRWALFAAYDFLRSISDDAGGTKGALTCEEVGALRMPLPPIDEQRAIVAHIATETAKLDALRSATERTIALLKERRAALIAAAVTGRLHIPEAA